MKTKLRVSNVIMYALGALVVSLYIIFLTGRVTDAETGKTHWSWFTTNGVKEFRLGMDVSGGVRLTYKVDFTKYAQQYTNGEDLTYMKKNALGIIKKQIDGRAGGLGVSDYKVYTKSIEENSYVIVELGGVHSLEEAKDIIGKTVELEFKLAFDAEKDGSAAIDAQRQALVNLVLEQVSAEGADFETVGQGKESDDVFYQEFVKQPVEQLPLFFVENQAMIANMQEGEVSKPIEGVFHTTMGYDEHGELQTDTFEGYTIVKFQGKEENKIDRISRVKTQSVANANDLEFSSTESFDNQGLEDGGIKYNAAARQLVHSDGPIITGHVAYQAEVHAIGKESQIGKEEDEIAAINAEIDRLSNEVQTALDNNQTVDIEGVESIGSAWFSQEDISKVIPGFIWDENGEEIQVFDALQAKYFVRVTGKKNPDEVLYIISTIDGVSPAKYKQLETELNTEVLISAETIFIKDSPSWIAAVDPDSNEVLNGAFFKQARLDTTQGIPTVAIDFDDAGKTIFCRITQEHTKEQMAIFVGGELQTAPVIQEEICGGTAIINGQENVKEARALIDGLNEGALPAPLVLANEEKVSAALGERALTASLLAGALGLLVIFIMLWVMYGHRKASVGILVLLMFLTYLMAFLKLPFVDYAFSLSGIAAIILSLGMGIDANILIFERVREELKSGKRMKAAIDAGYARSRNPIFDGNFSTFFIALFLVGWGIGVFKGFGSVMVLTIALILLVNVPLTKHLMHLFFANKKDYLNDK